MAPGPGALTDGGPVHRLPPLGAVPQSFILTLPADCPAGELRITATVRYALLVASVADLLGVPASESEPVIMGSSTVVVTVQ